MTRKTVVYLVFVALCALVAPAAVGCTTPENGNTITHRGDQLVPPPDIPSQPRTNFVVITVDDMRSDELRFMPNVQRLIGGHGFVFQRAYSTYPLCCPSRTCMVTGQFAHNHGVMGNSAIQNGGYNWFMQHAHPRNTLGVWLQQAGYTTSLIGKFLNKYGSQDPRQVPPGWTHWAGIPDRYAYLYKNQLFNINGKLVQMQGHNTKVVTRLAIRQMKQGTPFFTWVSYLTPHERSHGNRWLPPVPMATDRNRPVGRSHLVIERSMKDKPPFMRRLEPLDRRVLHEIEVERVARARALMGVDRYVGHIIRHLKKEGLLRNTVIIFNSDNGYALGEHNVPHGKTQPYEHVTRVPLMMRGSGVPVGATKRLVALHDIVPTILEFAGVKPRRVQDGVSLLETAQQPQRFRHRPMLYEGGSNMGIAGAIASTTPGKRFFTAIHAGKWVYIHYITGREELYNLRRDPDQLRSLHNKKAFADIKAQLAAKLAVLKDCQGEGCTKPFRLTR